MKADVCVVLSSMSVDNSLVWQLFIDRYPTLMFGVEFKLIMKNGSKKSKKVK